MVLILGKIYKDITMQKSAQTRAIALSICLENDSHSIGSCAKIDLNKHLHKICKYERTVNAIL